VLTETLKYLGIFVILAALSPGYLAAQDQSFSTGGSYASVNQDSGIHTANTEGADEDISDEDLIGGVFLLILLIAVIAICAIIFFLPTIIAFLRRHRNRWVILLINLFFGGTGIGWVGCLIWSLNKIDDPVKGGYKIDGQDHDPIV
jgi:4-amino-4-deoxy-L-arabinose transferase-like glycosyltransferase